MTELLFLHAARRLMLVNTCIKFPEYSLRGYIFQKLLLAWKFSCINKNCFFVKETDTFGHIVV